MSQTLPSGWQMVTLGELGKWATGGTPSRSEPAHFGGDVPWVKTGDLTDGPVVEIDETISELGLRNSNAKVFPKGTLLIALYGATIGKLGILECEAATNQACAALLPAGATAHLIPYLFWFLLSRREHLRAAGQGGAQPNISQGFLKQYQCPLPPLDEQRRIVARIEELTARSKTAKQALQAIPPLLEKFRQSVLAAAFRGDLTASWRLANPEAELAAEQLGPTASQLREKRVPKDSKGREHSAKRTEQSAISSLPVGWRWVECNQLATIQLGRQRSPDKHLGDNMVSYLRAANVTWRGISLGDVKQMHFSSEEVERFQLKAGDILLGEASGSASEVGKPAVWRGEIDTGSNPVFMHPAAN